MVAPFRDKTPQVPSSVFVAHSALVIGDVCIGEQSSIWYGTVVRGDVNTICIGKRTNIQDGSVIHVTSGRYDTVVGDEVTVGHAAVLHGCRIADRVLVGVGAIVLDGALVESNCMVAAGALVPPGKRFGEGSMIMGSPARAIRPLREHEMRLIGLSAEHYVHLQQEHKKLGGARTQ